MDLKRLLEMGPWEWPEDTGERLVGILRDDQADPDDRLIAAELAGDYTVVNDELAGILLDIVANRAGPEDLRATAAIALGPGLEAAYMFDDDEDDDDRPLSDEDEMPFSRETWRRIQQTLREVFEDKEAPDVVRRRAFEGSVRSPEDWHREAIRTAWEGEDEDWRLTAIFGMGQIRGFDQQILEALESANELIRFHAVCAAGIWEVEGAWPQIVEIIDGGEGDKDLLIAAISSLVALRPDEASALLEQYLDSTDEEVQAAAHEAISMAQGLMGEDEDGEDDTIH